MGCTHTCQGFIRATHGLLGEDGHLSSPISSVEVLEGCWIPGPCEDPENVGSNTVRGMAQDGRSWQ